MKERIMTYLKEHGKSNVNDLAAALEMAGAKHFPSLIKTISKMESQGLLRFSNDGSLALRKERERRKRLLFRGFSVLTKQVLVSCPWMRMKTICLSAVMTLVTPLMAIS